MFFFLKLQAYHQTVKQFGSDQVYCFVGPVLGSNCKGYKSAVNKSAQAGKYLNQFVNDGMSLATSPFITHLILT